MIKVKPVRSRTEIDLSCQISQYIALSVVLFDFENPIEAGTSRVQFAGLPTFQNAKEEYFEEFLQKKSNAYALTLQI